jgi:septal ring factor EnvC (AmiA/AmiB activator)
MDEKDKKIEALERELKAIKVQLAKAVRAINTLDQKVSRVKHAGASTAAEVQTLRQSLRRAG